MTQYALCTRNNKTFAVEGISDTAILLIVEGKVKPIKPSTFKRYYKLLDQQLKVDEQQVDQLVEAEEAKNKTKYKYYKSYKRNSLPLWDAVEENNKLILRDVDKNSIVICGLSNTKTCITIKQIKTNAKRYFTKAQQARKHILNNQDIRTIKQIGAAFDKWTNKFNIQ